MDSYLLRSSVGQFENSTDVIPSSTLNKIHLSVFLAFTKKGWLSSRKFFHGIKIYSYANFYCDANCSFVFVPNSTGDVSERGTASGGPCGRKPEGQLKDYPKLFNHHVHDSHSKNL